MKETDYEFLFNFVCELLAKQSQQTLWETRSRVMELYREHQQERDVHLSKLLHEASKPSALVTGE